MKFYLSDTTNPYFNIATEEYFLKEFQADFFYLYVNEPSLIVGKHQNTTAEVNIPFAHENKIKVVRRLSGGGTVYHDLNNLNYCFIQQGKEGYLVDFKKYTQPVLTTLQKLKVNAYLRGKSDLVINDQKFSGNAEHVYRNKILHHGTLLFNSKLDILNEAIKVDWDKFSDKAVRSNRSIVTNILDWLEPKLSLQEFIQEVKATVEQEFPTMEQITLTEVDKAAIEKLILEKYSTPQWNFAYSPKYAFQNELETAQGLLRAQLQVKKGIIEEVKMTLNDQPLSDLNAFLKDASHDYVFLKQELADSYSSIPKASILKVLY